MKTKKVKCQAGEFTVHQLTMRELWPVLRSDPEQIAQKLLYAAISKDGEKLGEAADDLCFQDYSKLMLAANVLNGMEGHDDEEKK